MKTTTENRRQVSHDEIAQRARQIWEREGQQAGRDLEYWLRAERELHTGDNRSSGTEKHSAPASTAQSPESSKASRGGPQGHRVMHI